MTAHEHRIYFLTQVVAHRLRKLADRRVSAAAGISTTQAAVMGIIDQDGPLHQREIARMLHQNESAMTGMIRRLEKAGLVTRVRSETDGRAWLVDLTDAGRTAREQIIPAFSTVNDLLDQALGGNADRFAADLNALIMALNTPED